MDKAGRHHVSQLVKVPISGNETSGHRGVGCAEHLLLGIPAVRKHQANPN